MSNLSKSSSFWTSFPKWDFSLSIFKQKILICLFIARAWKSRSLQKFKFVQESQSFFTFILQLVLQWEEDMQYLSKSLIRSLFYFNCSKSIILMFSPPLFYFDPFLKTGCKRCFLKDKRIPAIKTTIYLKNKSRNRDKLNPFTLLSSKLFYTFIHCQYMWAILLSSAK